MSQRWVNEYIEAMTPSQVLRVAERGGKVYATHLAMQESCCSMTTRRGDCSGAGVPKPGEPGRLATEAFGSLDNTYQRGR